MESPKLPERRNNEKLYLGIIAILTLVCGILAWQLFETKTNYQFISVQRNNSENEKNQLKDELKGMLEQYDKLKTDNQELSAEMLAQEEKIKGLLKEIDENKGTIGKYKREVVTLRTIMRSYVVTIDSLNTLNQELYSVNNQLSTENNQVKSRAQELEGRNNEMSGIISKAAILKTYGISVVAMRMKSSGKPQETDRAGKTELFKTCFKLGENNTAKAGTKSIFVRIVKPDGTVVTGDGTAESVMVEGAALMMSARREIEYNNKEQDVCIFSNNRIGLIPGTYQVQLFENSYKIGASTIVLR